MPTTTPLPTSLAGFERAAHAAMAAPDWAYLMSGVQPGEAGWENAEAWRELKLRPRILRGVEAVDTRTTLLGAPIAAPIMAAPNGRATRYHPHGEAALLEGVLEEGLGALLASSVAGSLGALRGLAPRALIWSQIYMARDRGYIGERVAAASDAGCAALVLTVDLVPNGNEPVLPAPAQAPWETPLQAAPAPLFAAATLDDLAWLCDLAATPVVVKGVLRADDARACVDAGAKGLVVSNHGGNQLADAVSTAGALPRIVEACPDAEIYVDGGIRSGAAILKALALGARAVMIGRPMSHGLAVAGAAGAAQVMSILKTELARAMSLCGAECVDAISRDLIAP